MKLCKVGETYHVKFKTGKGKRARMVSTGAKNPADARKVVKEAKIKEIEQAAMAGALQSSVIQTIVNGNQKKLIGGAVDEYEKWMTDMGQSPTVIKNKMDHIWAWLHYFPQMLQWHVDAIGEAQIALFINRPGEVKAGSRKVQLSAIRGLYTWMSAKGYCQGNVAKLVKVDYNRLSHAQKEPTKREPFTDDEYLKLLLTVDQTDDTFWKFAIRIGRITALRLGDVACLEWDTLREPGFLVVWTDKRDRRVKIPLSDDLAMVVLQLPSEHATFIFPTQRFIIRDPDSRSQLSVQFGRLCARAGIKKGKTFHCLRHTKATEVFNNTEGGIAEKLAAVQEALGHANSEISKGYVHASK